MTPDGNSRTSDALYVVSKEKVDVGDKLSLEGRVKEGYMEDLSVRQGQTFNKPSGSLTVTMLMASKVTKEGKLTYLIQLTSWLICLRIRSITILIIISLKVKRWTTGKVWKEC